jgi:hypothetical protein
VHENDVPETIKYIPQELLFSGFGGRKAPSSMGKISTVEVLRLRATSAVARDKPVTRFAQDDDFVGGDEKHPNEVSAFETASWATEPNSNCSICGRREQGA